MKNKLFHAKSVIFNIFITANENLYYILVITNTFIAVL